MAWRSGLLLAGVLVGVGCDSSQRQPAAAPLPSPVMPAQQQGTVELNILYVHGVQNCQDERQGAERALANLDAAIQAELPACIAEYEASHPGVTLVVRSARANLYTAAPSPFYPSDAPDPLRMDDWEVGDPGCLASRPGDPCTTAYEWRYRLAREIEAKFPAGAHAHLVQGLPYPRVGAPVDGQLRRSAAVGCAGQCVRGGHGDDSRSRCRHPGLRDGDHHPIDFKELTFTDGPNCTGQFQWTQRHDGDNPHAATFWWKTHALPAETSLVGTLPAN